MSRVAVRFVPRATPLDVVAVAAPRAIWPALAARLRRDDEGVLSELRAAFTDSVVIVIGDHVPWVDGATFLGRDPRAPRLLLPTALAPTVPVALLERALFARHPSATATAAVVLDPTRFVDIGRASPLDRASVEAWHREWAS